MASETLKELAKQGALRPLESPLKVQNHGKTLSIGIPKEIANKENRVALTPDAVSLLVKNGIEVNLEVGAGLKSNFSDQEYSNAGGSIVYSPAQVYENDIILKINPLQKNEFEYLKTNTTLISTLNVASLNQNYFKALNEKKTTCIGFEFIEDKVGQFPVIRAMSEIAGSSVLLIASEYLSSVHNGKGIILGGISGIPPTNVMIIGAGTVGEFAARSALGLGASIKVFDRQLYRLQRMQYAVGNRIFTSIIDSENLAKAIKEADVVIGALRGDNGIVPMVVTEEMVASMKENSIIIDVAIDQGGCIETSELRNHDLPVFKKHGVIHYCVPNIASRVPHTASIALSNIFTPFLIQTGGFGGISELIYHNQWFMKGVVCHSGNMTNLNLARKFNLKYMDLGLILSARK